MSRLYAAPSSSWRARIPYIIVIVFALGVAVAVGSRALGLWGSKPSSASDPNAITISYATEAGDGAGWGTVNSPLIVSIRVPWSTGSQDTVLSDVSVQLLDEAGQPAALGVETNTSAFAMKPTYCCRVCSLIIGKPLFGMVTYPRLARSPYFSVLRWW